MENSEKRHSNEGALVKFLERSDQTAAYVRETAEWVKKNYPGSVRTLIPKLRVIYKAKPKT